MRKTFIKAETRHMTVWLVVIMVLVIYFVACYLYLWPILPLPGIKDGWLNFFEWLAWTILCWYIFWRSVASEEAYRIEALAAKNAMKKIAGIEKPRKENKKSIGDLIADAVKAEVEKAKEEDGGDN